MLGTLHHFRPADAVAPAQMPELERLMLHQLAEQASLVRKAYAEFDYKTVVASLSAFMNTELSAFYFDIRKDTLYCDPPSSLARKATLTAIDIICDAILKWFAPVLSFTADEAWRMYKPDAEPSVHLALFPDGLETFRDEALAAKWEIIRAIRRVVTGALEVARAAKLIGSSLEASPIIYLPKEYMADLFDVDWAEVSITSNAEVVVLNQGEEPPPEAFKLPDAIGIGVTIERAVGIKCARSWKILPDVGADPEYPDVSPRDAKALREWKALGVDEGAVGARTETSKPAETVVKQPVEGITEKNASESAGLEQVSAHETAAETAAEPKRVSGMKSTDKGKETGGLKSDRTAKRADRRKDTVKASNARKAAKSGKAKSAAKSKSKGKTKSSGKAKAAAQAKRSRKAKRAGETTRDVKKKTGKKKTGKATTKEKSGKSNRPTAKKKTKAR
jgi:isoleucyl-tRNA synthetase